MQIIQYLLPDIFSNEATKRDFFLLPHDALRTVFSSSRSCCSEIQLFRALRECLVLVSEVRPSLERAAHSFDEEEKV